MAVPDQTYFGPDNITFGQVRNTTDPSEQIRLLKRRLDSFFIDQINALDQRSPFPLAIMCCIAIETLGAVFIDKKEDSQSYQFIRMLGKIDSGLSTKLPKKFLIDFKARWNISDISHINTRAELIYTFLRNTLIHGYYARGVYLNDAVGFKYEERAGFFALNPHWLWGKIKTQHEILFKDALKTENAYRFCALAYLAKMLK
jgi:hypothetical protein